MKAHRSFLHSIRKGIGPVLLAAATLLAAAALPVPASAAASAAATAVIPVQQTVENGSGTFSYTLTPEEQGAPMPSGTEEGVYQFSLTDTASREIDISCTAPGTWYYTLEAVKQDGYSYDVTKYRIGVQCVSKDDGTYSTEITALADGAEESRKAASVQFTISGPEAGIGDPSVTKYIRCTKKGTDGKVIRPSEDVDFHFTLTPYEEADRNTYPMPEGSENGSKTLTVTVKAGDRSASEEFGNISFDEPGIYNYRVTEEQESEAGFTYDGTVYRIEYVVTQVSGEDALQVQRTIYRVSGTSGSEKTEGRDVATFSNEYNPSTGTDRTTTTKYSGGKSTPSQTSSSTGSGSSTKSGRVKTGDTSTTRLYFGMLAGAAALLIILGVMRRRKVDGR